MSSREAPTAFSSGRQPAESATPYKAAKRRQQGSSGHQPAGSSAGTPSREAPTANEAPLLSALRGLIVRTRILQANACSYMLAALRG